MLLATVLVAPGNQNKRVRARSRADICPVTRAPNELRLPAATREGRPAASLARTRATAYSGRRPCFGSGQGEHRSLLLTSSDCVPRVNGSEMQVGPSLNVLGFRARVSE